MKEKMHKGHKKKVVIVGEGSLTSEVSSVILASDLSPELIPLPAVPLAKHPNYEEICNEVNERMEAIFKKLGVIIKQKNIQSLILILNLQALGCLSYDFIETEKWLDLLKILKEKTSLILCHDSLISKEKIGNYFGRLYDLDKREFLVKTGNMLDESKIEEILQDLTLFSVRWETGYLDISNKRETSLRVSGHELRKFLTSIKDELLDEDNPKKKFAELTDVKNFMIVFEEISKKKKNHLRKAMELIEFLFSKDLEFAQYGGNFEIGVKIQQFIEEIEQGIFLRLYVPYGRYQAEQLESFLRLIESYLQQVEKMHFSIDRKKTKQGTIYIYKSKGEISSLDDIQVAISRFDIFMKLCQNNRKEAERILINTGISITNANNLISKFLREYQRIELDIRHEDEKRLLDLRQSFETELLELMNSNQLTLPEPISPLSLLSIPNNTGSISIAITNSAVGDNPIMQNMVKQETYNDIHYTIEDRQLMDLFEMYAERLEAFVLKSHLELLKDSSAPDQERKAAKQKIIGFLSKVASTVGQSGLAVLTTYVEKKIMGT